MSYDETYYEDGVKAGVSLYTNYRWMPELTIPMVARLCEYLQVPPGALVLDFGCAKGFIVWALRLLGREAYGVDSSQYAVAHAPEDVRQYLVTHLDHVGSYVFDWVWAKDTLEHIPEDELAVVLGTLRKMGNNFFFVVPLGTEDGRYVIEAYERDATHLVRRPVAWWAALFSSVGFDSMSFSYHVPGMKDNWQKVHKEGNGCFMLTTGGVR